MRVSGFRKSKGAILQNWAKHLTDQIINVLKIAKTLKFMTYGNCLIFGSE